MGAWDVQGLVWKSVEKTKGGVASRPSPQSPKGILGSRPPQRQSCKLNAICNSFIFIALLLKST
ncbi:MAG: hypothetical protein PVS2B2_05880 [Candidatus Acidiferrum sp.]